MTCPDHPGAGGGAGGAGGGAGGAGGGAGGAGGGGRGGGAGGGSPYRTEGSITPPMLHDRKVLEACVGMGSG